MLIPAHLLASEANCTDRPLRTCEWHQSNDFYGHATILKQYAGLQPSRVIKAPIEHSLFAEGFSWNIDHEAPFPCLFTMGTYRFTTLREKTDKLLFSVGPIIQYAPPIMSAERLAETKRAVGRCLLVFLPKSSHRVNIVMDIPHIMREVDKVANHFDTILFCVGWKDVLRERHDDFAPWGTCVSAGHMYNPAFLSNLKEIFAISDMSMSFLRGSHIPYSVLNDTPHYMLYRKWETEAPAEIRKTDLLAPSPAIEQLTQDHMRLFGTFPPQITPEHREYLRNVAGVGESRTADELRDILVLAERAYALQQESGKRGIALALALLDGVRSESEARQAALLLDSLNATDGDHPAIIARQGIHAARTGQTLAATQAARRLATLGAPWKHEAAAILDCIR